MEAELQERRAKKEAEALNMMVDEVLHGITEKLNERRIRGIDLFRKIGHKGGGAVTAEELCGGLLWMGFDPSDKEFECLMQRLDKDGSRTVSLKGFDSALKAAERRLPKSARKSQKTSTMPNIEARTPRGAPKEVPSYVPLLEPLDATDEVFVSIIGQMNLRKYRSIDFFRTIDRDASGRASVDEFFEGLLKMGLQLSQEDFTAIVKRLDKDGSGDISGTEFDRAVKFVIKKVKANCRHVELETWPLKRPPEEPSTFCWASRSMRITQSGWSALEDTSARPCRTSHSAWCAASEGPRGIAWTCAGTAYGGSIGRERLFNTTLSGAHPTSLKMPPLPLHKTIYKQAVFNGRFELEPADLPSAQMLSTKETCSCSTKGRFKSIPLGSVKTYHNTPLMQSTVDSVVFNRDMDYSAESKFDEDYMALYAGGAGRPSWHKAGE